MSAPTPTDHYGFFPVPNVFGNDKENTSLVHVGTFSVYKCFNYDSHDDMVPIKPHVSDFDEKLSVSNYLNLATKLKWVTLTATPQSISMADPIAVNVDGSIHHLPRYIEFKSFKTEVLSAPLQYFTWCRDNRVMISVYWDVHSDMTFNASPLHSFLLSLFDHFYTTSSHECLEKELQDPMIEKPTRLDENFRLSLREYQQKTLTWMLRLENESPAMYIRRTVASEDGRKLFNLETGEVFNADTIDDSFFTKSTGGVLADDPGVGKTVTMLALHHATREQGTTMVLCPANLISQWESEAYRCLGPHVEVIKITQFPDLRALREDHLTSCSILLVPHSFLVNKNFLTRFRGCRVNLFQYPFHRLIIDEIHELVVKPTQKGKDTDHYLKMILKFTATHRWGMTGTPDFHIGNRLRTTASFLGVDVPDTPRHFNTYLDTCVRRSKPRFELPPLETETIEVRMGAEERAIYQMVQDDTLKALMLCSHFSMNDYTKNLTQEQQYNMDDATITVQEVSRQIKESRHDKIQETIAKINSKHDQVEANTEAIKKLDNEMKQEINEMKREKMVQSQTALRKSIKQSHEAITKLEIVQQKLERELLYFETSINLIKNRADYECIVCLEEFQSQETVALTRCGHAYCHACFEQLLETPKNAICPICRHPINQKEVFLVRPYQPDTPSSDKEDGQSDDCLDIDENLYGTKLRLMAARILTTLRQDPSARFIIFAQFRRLTKLVAKALAYLSVSNVVHGTAHMRDKAIRKFKSGDVQVILLSAESSVSGLHFPEANHVILLHPFYYGPGTESKAVASEKQGIARAWRFGQQRTVKVLRFVCVDTIEEGILRNRLDDAAQ